MSDFDGWYRNEKFDKVKDDGADPYYMKQAWDESEKRFTTGYVSVNCPLLNGKIATLTLPRALPVADIERLRKWFMLTIEVFAEAGTEANQ